MSLELTSSELSMFGDIFIIFKNLKGPPQNYPVKSSFTAARSRLTISELKKKIKYLVSQGKTIKLSYLNKIARFFTAWLIQSPVARLTIGIL